MPTLTIRNVDAKIVERLKDKARQENRSLEAELRAILDKAAGKLTAEEFFKGANAIAETTRGIPQTDSALIQRQMRDELAGIKRE